MATTPAVPDVKYSMLVVPADGVTRQYEFNFAGGYISRDHIKIQYENDSTGEVTEITDILWVNADTIALGTAVATIPVGNTVTVYRDTPKDRPLVDYTDGAIINEANLDRSFNQAIFASAEMVDRFLTVQDISETANTNALAALDASATATALSSTANANAASALSQANAAVATAGTANSNAATALSTANGVDAKATTALSNSAAAVATANGVDAKATTALSNSADAVATASAANSTAASAQAAASAVDAKATTALANAATALSTANSASSTANSALSTANGVDAKAQSALDASATNASAITALDAAAVKKTSATGAANLPAGTTAQRDGSPATGAVRYNSSTTRMEYYDGSAWHSFTTEDKPSWDVYLNDAQSVTPGTATRVNFNQTVRSSGVTITNSGATVTVARTGWYEIGVAWRASGDSASVNLMELHANSSVLRRMCEFSTLHGTTSHTAHVYLTAGDVLDVYGTVFASANATFAAVDNTGRFGPRFTGIYLGTT